jgi:hypothetical protein
MEESERKAHICCDCRARSPETDTNYTLISSRYGWRLSRHVASDGTFIVEWRCPRCWERYKKAKTAGLSSMTPEGGIPAVPDSGPASNRSRSTPPPPRTASSRPPPARKRR